MKTLTRFLVVAVPALTLGIAGGTAVAKVTVPQQCSADATKLCKMEVNGNKEVSVFDCLVDRKTELTDTCRRFVDARADCEPDVAHYCKGSIFDSKYESCLDKHRGELAQACKEKLGWTAKAMRPNLGLCATDFEKVCSSLAPMPGKEFQCLNDHRVDLSQACREDVDKRMEGAPDTSGMKPPATPGDKRDEMPMKRAVPPGY